MASAGIQTVSVEHAERKENNRLKKGNQSGLWKTQSLRWGKKTSEGFQISQGRGMFSSSGEKSILSKSEERENKNEETTIFTKSPPNGGKEESKKTDRSRQFWH